MHELLRLIEHELIAKIFRDKPALATFTKGEQSFFALCLFFVVIGAAFMIYAAYLWLSGYYSAEMAATLTGALSLTCALAMAVVICGLAQYRRSQIKKIQGRLFDKIKVSLEKFEDAYADPVREYPKISVLFGSIIGFILEKRLS